MSFWGKLGKIGLKIAPYAAMAIPGVGPLASMGIQAGIGAAQKKASGGSWLDALKSGGISGAASYVGGKVPGLDKIAGAGKGLAPSGNFVKEAVSGTANKALGKGGVKSILGNIAKQTGKNILTDVASRKGGGVDVNNPSSWGGEWGGGDFSGQGNLGNRIGLPPGAMNFSGQDKYRGDTGPQTAMPREDQGLSRFHRQMRRQLGPVMGVEDQSNPNLANAIGAGRMEAMRDRKRRQGVIA